MKDLLYQIKALINDQWPAAELPLGSYGVIEGELYLFTLQYDPFKQIILQLSSENILTASYMVTAGSGTNYQTVIIEQINDDYFQVQQLDGLLYQSRSSVLVALFVLSQLKGVVKISSESEI